MSSPFSSTSYLPHINGLRAVAILGVLVYHLRASYCPAGYFGVDLFLVISGFLLFRALLTPGAESRFHYGNFLLKKFWRIIPLWFVVTALVCYVSVHLLEQGRLRDVLLTARSSATLTADYYIDHSGDYFNVFSQQNPLLHYWYLSLTLQLYILAPLLVIPLVLWCSRRAAVIFLGVLALLSLGYYVLSTADFVPAEFRRVLLEGIGARTAYYHLIPRLWEILAGLGILLLPGFDSMPRLRASLGALGLAGLIASFFAFETGSSSVYLAVLCSMLALRYACSGPAAWLLCSKPLQALGTISFSLYLCHWPIMVFWKYARMDAPGLLDELAMLASSLVVGTACWWGIERLKAPTLSGWSGSLLRGSLLLLLPLVGVAAVKTNSHMRRLQQTDTAAAPLAHAPVNHVGVETDAEVLLGFERFQQFDMMNPPRRLGSGVGKPAFILMGDSHSFQHYDALHEACTGSGLRGLFLNNGVAPFWNLELPQRPGDATCWSEDIAETMLAVLREHPEIRFVVLALFWEQRATSWSAAYGTDWRTGKRLADGDEIKAFTSAGLREFCNRVREQGKEVIILGDNPHFSFAEPSPKDEWERCQRLKLPWKERVVTQEQHLSWQGFSQQLLRQLADEGIVHYVELAPAMMVNGAYPARINGEFMYSDINHLTPAGSRRAVRYVFPRLLEIMQ